MTTASLCGPTCGSQFFIHVGGAMLLFGGALAVALLSFAALRAADHALLLRRLTFWTTLALVLPAYVVMRVGAQLVLNHEHLDKNSPGWVGAGFAISDGGAILILLLLLLSWLSWKRARVAPAVAWLSGIYVVALGVAWFFMSAKP